MDVDVFSYCRIFVFICTCILFLKDSRSIQPVVRATCAVIAISHNALIVNGPSFMLNLNYFDN